MSLTNDFIQFITGGSLFGGGIFLLANQVMASSAFTYRGGGWGRYGGGGSMVPFGTPGMGLLMIPLGIGVCLLFTGAYKRWANLLVWGSVAALGVGVLNSIRLTFMPTTLWQLGVYIVMIAAGGGLMFRGLRAYDAEGKSYAVKNEAEKQQTDDLRREIEALKARLDERNGNG